MSEGTKTFDVVREIIDVKRRLEELERASRQPQIPRQPHYPVIPGIQPYVPITPTLPDANKCGKCGLVLGPVMGYCCPNADCPCCLGGTSCMATG